MLKDAESEIVPNAEKGRQEITGKRNTNCTTMKNGKKRNVNRNS